MLKLQKCFVVRTRQLCYWPPSPLFTTPRPTFSFLFFSFFLLFGQRHFLRHSWKTLKNAIHTPQSQEFKVSGVRIREVQVCSPVKITAAPKMVRNIGSGNSSGSQEWENAAVLDQTECGGAGFALPFTTLSRRKGHGDAPACQTASGQWGRSTGTCQSASAQKTGEVYPKTK